MLDEVELKAISISHAASVFALYSDSCVATGLMHVETPYTVELAREFCSATPDVTGQHRYAVRLSRTGEIAGVGTIRDLVEDSGFVSIGYSVTPRLWGQGLGTRVARLLIVRGRDEFSATEVRASTLDSNARSRRVLQKMGFQPIGPGPSSRGRAVTQSSLKLDLEG